MKSLISIVLVIFVAFSGVAQNGINYKAIIKDSNGNLVANNIVVVEFSVLQGAAQNNVYKEMHTPTTDSNGLIILNIGEGTPMSGTFSTIDWGSDITFLNTQIKTGASFVDMGTTEFKTVPYAIAAQSAGNVSGLETINDGNGVGWRLIGKFPDWYAAIGANAVDLSSPGWVGSTSRGASGSYSIAMGNGTEASGSHSTAMGLYTEASGNYSTAMGEQTIASGNTSIAMGFKAEATGEYSTAMGRETKASGEYSTTMGYLSEASGDYSLAIGYNTTASDVTSFATGFRTTASEKDAVAMGTLTTASGRGSTAMGYGTTASSFNSLAIGRYNVGGGAPIHWYSSDPLFEVGNGTNNNTKSNAFTILKDGKVGIGTATPNTYLHVTKGSAINNYSGYSGYFLIGEHTATNMVFDTNRIQARNNGDVADLYLQRWGGNVRVGTTIVHSSDRRLKKDITILPYGLETILKLNPVTYNWKDRVQDHKSLGLIAQDVQSIISEIVNVADDADKTLSISYTELIPVLIKAMQEQQGIIDSLQSTVGSQQSIINTLTSELDQVKTLNNRVNQLEALLVTPNQ